ncbi:unnamed protein product [Thelazia callipaeda]|uniref:L-type lectin-like domain-containing protein n=1 Tax=Thelazia callipaeda TaxID=103827 RepID=A0A0N5CMH8_THECL|nr:unnamed protein product [Thelazia callipaeda]
MMWTISSLLLLFTVYRVPSLEAMDSSIQRHFEYKHSFRAPDLSLRDGTIPFWTIIGDAVASKEQLRLAPSMRSRRGLAWNKRAMTESDHFEINVAFQITGQGRVGADGIAVWYVAQQPILGPVFGANDYWTGMGLFLDSFDNDAQKNNPFIALMINDGTKKYDHQTDGSQQMLSGCQKDFRNKPYPVHMKVEYLRNVLTVSMSDGLLPQARYELCIRAENIFLPRNGYFGISAATGGLADDHDIIEFSVFSLYTDRPQVAPTLPQEERQKYDAEFEERMQEYEKQRQKFKEEHPEKVKPDTLEEEMAKIYEDTSQREMRMILEMQTSIHQILQHIENNLKDIGQNQNVQSSLIQQCVSGSNRVAATGSGSGDEGFRLHEKNEALQSLRDLTANIRDMKSYVNEIFTRTYNLEQKMGSSGVNLSPSAAGSDPALRSLIETIQNDVRQIRTVQLGSPSAHIAGGSCPNISCLSSSFFIGVVLAQSVIIIVILWIRSKPEKAKFY